jgi:CubicO group peptidase (beta-lactamase class C family)
MFSVIILLWCCLLQMVAGVAQEVDVGELRSFVEGLLSPSCYGNYTPGLGLAVVRDGEVLLAESFGVRSLAGGEPANQDTLWAMGSSTKSMTSMLLASLVKEGKLSWDTRVKDIWPEFQLADSYADERLNIRDILSHRSGLNSHDAALFSKDNVNRSRADILSRMRYLQPLGDFRTQWQYNNYMFVLAGYLVERLTGQTWEDFIQDRLFENLNMTHTFTSFAEVALEENLALPHGGDGSAIPPVINEEVFPMAGPAGTVSTTVTDIARWLQFLVDPSLFNVGGLSQRDFGPLWTIHSSLSQPAASKDLYVEENGMGNYGLGWFIARFKERTMVYHPGDVIGLHSRISVIPSARVAVAVFSNGGEDVRELITYFVNSHLLLPPEDREITLEYVQNGCKENWRNVVQDSYEARGEYTKPVWGRRRRRQQGDEAAIRRQVSSASSSYQHLPSWTAMETQPASDPNAHLSNRRTLSTSNEAWCQDPESFQVYLTDPDKSDLFSHPAYGEIRFGLGGANNDTLIATVVGYEAALDCKAPDTFSSSQGPPFMASFTITFRRSAASYLQPKVVGLSLVWVDMSCAGSECNVSPRIEFVRYQAYPENHDLLQCAYPVSGPSIYLGSASHSVGIDGQDGQPGQDGLNGQDGPPGAKGQDGKQTDTLTLVVVVIVCTTAVLLTSFCIGYWWSARQAKRTAPEEGGGVELTA